MTALVLGCLLAGTTQAENLRVLGVAPNGLPTARPAVMQEPHDGLDPVMHHVLFDTPSDFRAAQILWHSQSEPIVMERATIDEAYAYPMVLHATLPSDADLMYQVWSIDERRLIESFTHFVTGPEDWGVDPDRIDALRDGSYILMVNIRIGGMPRAQATQAIIIGDAGEGGAYAPPLSSRVPQDGGPDQDGMELPLELPPDGRIIYVSSSTGNDANDGLTPQTALRTPMRGIAKLRDGRPDWLLFRRGDTFRGGLDRWRKSGRSADEPMVIGSYGNANQARPKFLTDGDGLVHSFGDESVSFVILSDLHASANERDPDSPDFEGGGSREFGVRWSAASRSIRFENLLIEYYAYNMSIGERTEYDIYDISVHGSVLRNAYALEGLGHSEGLFADRVQGLTITECVLDHNGWNDRVPRAVRTGFNHNAYIYQCRNVLIEGNVIARGSNLGLKLRCDEQGFSHDINVLGNLFVGNLTGLSAGGDPIDGDQGALVHERLTIRGNVFTQNGGALPNGVVLGVAVSVKQVGDTVIEDNLFIDKGADTNWYAIEINTRLPNGAISITDNVVARWAATEPLINGAGADQDGVSMSSNSVNQTANSNEDAPLSLSQYLQTQTAYGSIEEYCDALANPVGVDMAGPNGAPAIVDSLQRSFSAGPGIR